MTTAESPPQPPGVEVESGGLVSHGSLSGLMSNADTA
jgi:hypothetical protein